jgi:predicted alpha/beta hydrolase family esterase
VLILGSERDPIGCPESLRRLHQAWPGTYLEIFPYGHISYRLHTSAMERFLDRLAPQLMNRKSSS